MYSKLNNLKSQDIGNVNGHLQTLVVDFET
jgi:hypothetical protein